jgi:ORF6N domain
VETRVLNQAVKRNIQRFPDDFVFRLSPKEAEKIFRSRSQSVILKRGQNIKYLPYAFTEHGAIMAAKVINSTRAVQMSGFVVRAFVRLRHRSQRIGGQVERVGEEKSPIKMETSRLCFKQSGNS